MASSDRYDIIFDMETNDPDDFVTLLFLLGHPKVNLKCLTLVPGTPDQIGFIRFVLNRFNRGDLPLGVFNMQSKPALAKFHLNFYPNESIGESTDAEDASQLIYKYSNEKTILICGGPLKNVAKAVEIDGFQLGRLVAQGGFAGDNIVPKQKRLPKFDGRITCQTFNLCADLQAAQIVLNCQNIKEKYFVSKNVCHGVVYNRQTHSQLQHIYQHSQSLTEIYRVMSIYLQKKQEKIFHDPLAACCAIDLSIGQWKHVQLYLDDKTKQWGSRISDQPNVFIIIDYDQHKYISTLFQY